MMKIFQAYHWIVFLFLTILCSCTNDIDDHLQLLKQIVEVNVDGSSTTTVLSYDGNKISSIDNNVIRSDFFYTGDLITKIEEFDKVNKHENTLKYIYSNNDLVKIISSDNDVMNYTYNTDGSISYEKLMKNSNNNDVRVFHGILYFLDANLIKDDLIFDDTSDKVLRRKSSTLEYDYKNNALRNILGFNKLLNYYKSISLNNSILSTEVTEVKNLDTNQVISSIKLFKSEYKYKSGGFPIEIISEKVVLGNGGSSIHLKTKLYYD
ncbi:hypothetical protein [Flavobacterium cellulosilyticum]|uniref:DUF4595 domain-containing protein n=1 Tax=Flavobacterium cellulosilyticum TaxID=2541731 RepID=A0A4R5CBG1_9FLAO|nr:hypothetical protein [Flavobacterium cellulosilyticum]TDD94412.1 hypothetical protein E0F76_16580 [Flavobacterium cellulosilyticum]